MNTSLFHDPSLPEEIKEQMRAESKAIVEKFFDLAHLHEVKEMLNEIKEQLINKSFNHKEDSIAYSNTIYFFERLDQLIDAVYILR